MLGHYNVAIGLAFFALSSATRSHAIDSEGDDPLTSNLFTPPGPRYRRAHESTSPYALLRPERFYAHDPEKVGRFSEKITCENNET